MRRRLRGGGLALLTALLLAACGGSDGEGDEPGRAEFDRVAAAVEGLAGKEREGKLLQLAEAEGSELSLYTSLTAKTEVNLVDAFEERYDLDVAVFRSASATVAERVSEEAQAGFRGADLVETSGPEMVALTRAGIFRSYDAPAADGLIAGSSREGWHAIRYNNFVVSWNTRLVPEGGQPRSLEELADPRWKGKLALEEGDADWYKTIYEYWTGPGGKTEAETDRLLEGIARNARVIASHSLLAELLAAGEFAVAPTNYLHQAKDTIEKGAPVAFTPMIEPVFSRPQGVGVVASARHPAAALLFVDWVLTEGQEVLKENNVDPARKDLFTAPDAEVVLVRIEEFVDEQEEWTERFDRLLALGEKVEDG